MARDVVPGWALFPLGLGVLLVGFNLFDKVMPTVGSESLEHRPGAWYTRKWSDTLVAAILLGNQDGVRVTVTVTLTVTVWTLALLAFGYPLLRRLCLGVARRAVGSHARLGASWRCCSPCPSC